MKTKQHFSDRVWQFFCSVKLTIYTLVLLTAASIVGTLVLQEGSHAQYVSLYGKPMARLIQSTGIDSIYRVWWFLGLLVILCLNIIVCSVERLSKTWKIIFPDRISISPDRLSWVKDKRFLDSESTPEDLETICHALLKKRTGKIIRIEDKDGIILYGEKGRWSKMGVYVVHASVVLLLLGALIGAVFGFKGTMRLEEGKKSNMVKSMESGAPIPLEFDIQCNRFAVSFYDTGAPKDYVSNITLLKGDNILETRDIRVNHPLRFQGINIFQSSYGEAPPSWAVFHIVDTKTGQTITQKITRGQSISLPEDSGHFVFKGSIPNFRFMGRNLGQALVGIVHNKGQKSRRIGLPTKFPSFDKMRKGRFAFHVKEFEQRYYTGLQVTKDPGVWYVYTGFILMILGCWVTFFISFDRYVMEIRPGVSQKSRVILGGKTNRNPGSMKIKLEKLTRQIPGTQPGPLAETDKEENPS